MPLFPLLRLIYKKITVKMDQDKGIYRIYYMIVQISAKYTKQFDTLWWNEDWNFLQMCIYLVLLYNIWYRELSCQCLFCVSLCLLASDWWMLCLLVSLINIIKTNKNKGRALVARPFLTNNKQARCNRSDYGYSRQLKVNMWVMHSCKKTVKLSWIICKCIPVTFELLNNIKRLASNRRWGTDKFEYFKNTD